MRGESIQAVSWENDALVLIDQTRQPADLDTASGGDIHIEVRDGQEVTLIADR